MFALQLSWPPNALQHFAGVSIPMTFDRSASDAGTMPLAEIERHTTTQLLMMVLSMSALQVRIQPLHATDSTAPCNGSILATFDFPLNRGRHEGRRCMLLFPALQFGLRLVEIPGPSKRQHEYPTYHFVMALL